MIFTFVTLCSHQIQRIFLNSAFQILLTGFQILHLMFYLVSKQHLRPPFSNMCLLIFDILLKFVLLTFLFVVLYIFLHFICLFNIILICDLVTHAAFSTLLSVFFSVHNILSIIIKNHIFTV